MREAAAKGAAAQQAAEQAAKATWDTLASAVPAAIAAIDSRVTMLAKSKKLPANVTKDALASAQSNLASAKSQWEQATNAQTAGKLSDAVIAAQQAKVSADTALASLGMSS